MRVALVGVLLLVSCTRKMIFQGYDNVQQVLYVKPLEGKLKNQEAMIYWYATHGEIEQLKVGDTIMFNFAKWRLKK